MKSQPDVERVHVQDLRPGDIQVDLSGRPYRRFVSIEKAPGHSNNQRWRVGWLWLMPLSGTEPDRVAYGHWSQYEAIDVIRTPIIEEVPI